MTKRTEDIFDRKWFNRLYFCWFSNVYSKSKKIAEQVDKIVIGGLGKKMAEEIKEQFPKKSSMSDITYLYESLKRSHWFQEKVQVYKKNDKELVLQTKDCSFQKPWVKEHKETCNCVHSHKDFLESFCKEINKEYRVENLIAPKLKPKDDICCRWRIYLD